MAAQLALIQFLGAPGVPTHPIVIPPDGIGPGVPTHPIVIPPPTYPAHPIVIPPDSIGPGVPTHPIVIPIYPDQGLPGDQPYPDQGLPGSQPRPDNTLPGSQPRPDQGLPGSQPRPDQGLPGDQPIPSHPIVLPPFPEFKPDDKAAVLIVHGGEAVWFIVDVNGGLKPPTHPTPKKAGKR